MNARLPEKRVLRAMLEERRLDEVAELASARRRVFGTLLSLLYDPEALVAWRAVEALGEACARVVGDDPHFAREQLRRLLWLITEESGGICWRAPEAMAEIVSRRPDLFGDYVPIIAHLPMETAEEDLEHFRPGMLWAVGRLGVRARAAAPDVIGSVAASLTRPDPPSRAMAAWCLGRLGETELLARRRELLADAAAVELYEEGQLRRTTVASITAAALRGAPCAP
ncbi:MAG TPA: hypothetical protein VLH75_17080 [Longimicrobiales bacterium]|nr:hypothetical protein [Longimicrobiales bacterium]